MSNPQMTQAEMLAKIAKLEGEKQELADAAARKVQFKVSPKTGIVCVYGIRTRMPISAYASEWEILFANRDRLNQYMADNASILRKKGESEEVYRARVKSTWTPRAEDLNAA